MNDKFDEYYIDFDSMFEEDDDEINFTEASLNSKVKKELVSECKKYKLDTKGTKAELILRLLEFKQSSTVLEAESEIKAVKIEKGVKGERV